MWLLETQHNMQLLMGETFWCSMVLVVPTAWGGVASSKHLPSSHWFSIMLFFQQSHLFDNVGTVFFAIFMGIWGE